MVQLNTTLSPSVFQGAVGRHPEVSGTDLDVLIVERIGANGDILCGVSNESQTENLVVEIQQGDLNTDADYAVTNILVNGSSVSSITVPPACSATFVIPGPGIGSQGPGVESSNTGGVSTRFIRVVASDQTKAFGAISMTYYTGSLERRKLYS